MILNRIQSKENLYRRRAIQNPSQTLYSLCLQVEESTFHLFFTCVQSWKIWNQVNCWLGALMVMPEEGKMHLLMFLGSCPRRDRKNGLGFVWLSTIWYIWHLRNNVIFNGGDIEMSLALDSIQYRSWIWLKGRIKGFYFTMYEWTSNPLIFLESL